MVGSLGRIFFVKQWGFPETLQEGIFQHKLLRCAHWYVDRASCKNKNIQQTGFTETKGEHRFTPKIP